MTDQDITKFVHPSALALLNLHGWQVRVHPTRLGNYRVSFHNAGRICSVYARVNAVPRGYGYVWMGLLVPDGSRIRPKDIEHLYLQTEASAIDDGFAL